MENQSLTAKKEEIVKFNEFAKTKVEQENMIIQQLESQIGKFGLFIFRAV
jgi:hypothetical protein